MTSKLRTMTDPQLRRLALVLVAIMFVGFIALGAALQSWPWLFVGGWMGIALAAELLLDGKDQS